ncbi:hypothetical protein PRIC1_012144 [Phytophthora ramorum]
MLLPVFTGMSVAQGLASFMVAQMSCGGLLAMVFSVGHNGMSVYEREEKPDFWQLQIEHHLFPMMPCHNLQKVNSLVKSLYKQYDVRFHETGFYTGLVKVVDELAEISKEFLLEFPAM